MPHKIPGKTTYDPITLAAGVTHDPAFEDWANKVNNFQGDAAMSLRNFRKDITIEVLQPARTTVLRLQRASAAGCRSTPRCPSSTRRATQS